MRKSISLCAATLLFSIQIAVAQTKDVSGKVTDAKDGSPLAGATVKVKGSTTATVSLGDGSFKLSVPAKSTTLEISYTGYKDVEVAIGSGALDIKLTAADKNLAEVVVVGYGTKIKRDVTSSIARVSSKDFQNQPLNSFESALQGRASGVYINQGSGKLGQGLVIRVRGISSISAAQQPFVVIDGVPVQSASLGSAGEPDNPLATINPDDIESIEILKDAAASAIYGSRASNGVLLITTKSGKVGKTKVTVGYFGGVSTPTKKQEFLNAAQYKELFGYAAANSDFGALDAGDEFGFETGTNDWNSTNDVNWADQAFQDGAIHQVNFSINGGDAKTKFLISSSLNDQKGIIIGNRLQRVTGRFNIDHTINAKFKVGANISLNRTKNFRVSADNEFSNPLQLNALPPLQPLRAADGSYNTATLYYNNLVDQEGSYKFATTYRTISSVFGEYVINPYLTFRSQVGIDWNNLQEESYLGKETLDGAPTGEGFNNQVTATIVTNTNTLNFRKKFSDNVDFDALAGMEYQYGSVLGANVTGRGFPNDKFTKIASAAIIAGGSSTQTAYTFVSYFSKANYKYKDRYLVGGSFRVDGSSRFGKDNRYGIFPAASLGWIVSEENWLKNSKTLSFLKLRSSYGKTGNAEIGNFSSLSLFGGTAYADIAGILLSQIGDGNLSWESTNQFDLGIDFGFLNNKISGEIDYFYKKTSDLLLSVSTPATSGITSVVKNVGDMENRGFEFVLNTTNIQRRNFTWTSSFNISTYKNKVTRLVVPVPPGQRTLGRLAVGQPFGQFFGRKYAGVDPANGDALYYQANGTATNSYSGAPDQVIGDPNPDYYGGLNNKFSYKGFDLDIQCQFVSGNDLYNMAGFFQSVNGDYFDNQTVDQLNHWKKPGDITSIPEARLYSGNGAGKSSRWVQDGSYFRVKSVNFGYNVPRSVTSRFKFESARLYMAATNLFTLTSYDGYDPELNSGFAGSLNLGHDFYTPPQAKTITVGINLVF
jgi:TonB-linked SusC/RagA family outer membrane protein